MKLPFRQTRWPLGLTALALCLCTALSIGCMRSNSYPVIASLEAKTSWVKPLSSCEVKCVASDADGDALTYNWSATGGGFFGAGPDITWVAPRVPGTYVIAVAVTDGKTGEARNQVTVGVRTSNSPLIKSLTANPPTVVRASTSVIECVASDPDGDELMYQWTATGGNISGKGATATWTAPNRSGGYIIRVIVTDTMGGGASRELKVIVTCGCGDSQE
jgi:hypothetical protein